MTQINPVVPQVENKEVSISLNKEAFATFVLDFLGKKEKLVYKDAIDFILNHNDVEQFYYLINEKVSREQYVFIDHFLVTISYNDNTTREISGIESLQRFLETRHVYPESITLTWNIIVRFPNAETIENQRIDLTFNIDGFDKRKKGGGVILSISHTNQAWGIEVLNLIKDKIKNVSIARPGPAVIAAYLLEKATKELILLLLMIVATLFTMLAPDYKNGRVDPSNYYKTAESINQSTDVKEIIVATLAIQGMDSANIKKTAENLIASPKLKESLKQIGDHNAKIESTKLYVPIAFLGLVFSIVVVRVYLEKLFAYYGSSSHILVTARAQSRYDTEKASKGKTEFYSITFIVFTVVLGIVANFIYQMVTSFWG